MNNFPSLEERINEYYSGRSEDVSEMQELLARKAKAAREVAAYDKGIKQLAERAQRDNDNCVGLDILAKVKQGKYIIVDLETSQPVKINFA